MSEPERLHLDPESPLERSLLAAGRDYRASSRTRVRLLGALGVSVATTATGSAAASSQLVLGKVAMGLLVVGGLAVPAALYLRAPSSAPPVPSTAPLAAIAVPVATVEVRAAVAPKPSARAPRAEPRALPAASAPLGAELAALDGVRTALSRGEPAGALAGLDAYARGYPNGKLRLEAEVLRIAALAESGQRAAARERALRFLARHPNSLLATRVRGYAAP